MALIEFFDNRARVKAALNEAIIAYLHEMGGEMKSQTQHNTRVDTGQTKGSWTYVVDQEAGECVIGSPLQNAIWEEFGTGEFADDGKGRKELPWVYRDAKGKFHTTRGKKPSRAFQTAFNKLKNKLVKRIGTIISEAMNSDN